MYECAYAASVGCVYRQPETTPTANCHCPCCGLFEMALLWPYSSEGYILRPNAHTRSKIQNTSH